MNIRPSALAIAIVSCAACAAWADPPRVVQASPDHGDVGVDPGVREIRIEFDQPMSSGGQSICGGGDTFPRLTDKPRWEKAADGTVRVLVLPVTLDADHVYRLGVNCPGAQNCRSASGEPAEITPIWFRTGQAGTVSPPTPTPEDNRAARDALRRAIADQYSYRDLRVKDWDARFEAASAELESARTRGAFARAAARLLAAANDPHLHLRIGDALVGTARGGVRPNVDLARVAALVPGFVWKNQAVGVGTFEDGVGYLAITSWSPDLMAPALEALDHWQAAPGVVIDVRANGGGDELAARSVAARFVNVGAVYSKNQFRQDDGFGPLLERRIEPAPENARCRGRVVVLMGPACMSSCESFLLMMRYGAKAPLLGATSRGSSGNPKPVELGNGVTAVIPTWRDTLPDGTLLEGRGVTPDETVPWTDTGDPVLEAALRRLRP